jgi:hypothetical protein
VGGETGVAVASGVGVAVSGGPIVGTGVLVQTGVGDGWSGVNVGIAVSVGASVTVTGGVAVAGSVGSGVGVAGGGPPLARSRRSGMSSCDAGPGSSWPAEEHSRAAVMSGDAPTGAFTATAWTGVSLEMDKRPALPSERAGTSPSQITSPSPAAI